MSAAPTVTDETFESVVLESKRTVLVEFGAVWCPPCRAVGPILDQIASEHSEKIDIVKIDSDESPRTAAKYQVTSVPAMKVYQNGVVVKTIIGAKSKPALEHELADYLA